MCGTSVHSGFPYGFISGPVLSLTYINDLIDDFSSITKRSTDDTSMSSTVHDVHTYGGGLNNDLEKD